VHDRSAALGAEMLPEVIREIERGTAPRIPQDAVAATYAKKIEKEECEIDFTLPAARLDCILRGLTPIPLPYTYLPNGKMCKILRAFPTDGKGEPGMVLALDEHGDGSITVACGVGALCITSLRPEGKGNMSAADFIRGRQIKVGERLGR
jgi:methionyl-tRNA formyltransferase